MEAVTTEKIKPVVVYDGQCGFCRTEINKLRKRDKEGLLEFVPRQESSLERRFPEIMSVDFEEGMLLIKADRQIEVGADAFYEIWRCLPDTKGSAWLLEVPLVKPMGRLVYKLIAANRHRLGNVCTRDSCDVEQQKPTEDPEKRSE
jgi:predicted DCC family thiol-disulfide oxidoreductase YuxK